MINDQTILELIFQTAQGSINIPLIIILLAIGFIVKHCMTKVPNDTIPPIMLISGIVLALIINIPYAPSDITSIVVQGIVSGAAAIGLHTNGKGLLEVLPVFNKSNGLTQTEDSQADASDTADKKSE